MVCNNSSRLIKLGARLQPGLFTIREFELSLKFVGSAHARIATKRKTRFD